MIRHAYAVEVEFARGKLPGYYAQIIHQIGDAVQVSDRAGSGSNLIFILSGQEQLEPLTQILEKYKLVGETYELIQLPPSIEIMLLDDYGFTGIEGNNYVFAHLVDVFRMEPAAGQAQKNDGPGDSWAVIEQLREYLIAVMPDPAGDWYLIDSNHRDLALHIAKRYNVGLQFIE